MLAGSTNMMNNINITNYIKDKIKTARLALTDVTPPQLLTEEATNDHPWVAPDPRTLALISRSAFEIDDYSRIVDILHKKLSKFDGKKWRESYKALFVLEYLLTHGPKSVADDFQTDIPIIKNFKNFHHVDEKGFNWGVAVRKKSERVVKLLENGTLLEEERQNARNLTKEIKGFGSFSGISTSHLNESSTAFGRSISQFNFHGNGENLFESKSKTMKRLTKENEDDIHGGDDIEEEDHPFTDTEKNRRESLLDAKKQD